MIFRIPQKTKPPAEAGGSGWGRRSRRCGLGTGSSARNFVNEVSNCNRNSNAICGKSASRSIVRVGSTHALDELQQRLALDEHSASAWIDDIAQERKSSSRPGSG